MKSVYAAGPGVIDLHAHAYVHYIIVIHMSTLQLSLIETGDKCLHDL